MRRQIAIELAVVFALFVLAGFIWLHPASAVLLRGDASTSIGDGTDSILVPVQYQIVVDTFRDAPSRLLFGGVYSDQLAAPEGQPLFISFSERALVLFFAPFLKADLMPTAVVWAYLVLSGLAMYGCARLLGWRRTVALALTLAWAVCPYTRARAVVHNAMVGVFFAPLVIAALRILAGSPPRLAWSPRKELVVAALFMFIAVTGAQYYVLMLIGFSPLIIALYVAMLPKGTPKLRAIGRLFVAALPALFLLAWMRFMPASPSDARHFATSQSDAAAVAKQADDFLHWYGAHASHYLAGDVKFGDRDVIPWRAAITRSILEKADNTHEQTNGIRWTILACTAALVLALLRKRSRRRFTREERKIALVAIVLGTLAFVVSFSPQGISHYGTELGPSLLLAKLLPQFRVSNRAGVVVHFCALLCTGLLLAAYTRGIASSRGRAAVGAGLLVLVVVEYLPLHPVVMTELPRVYTELQPPEGQCGAGLIVPYASWDGGESAYYRTQTALRGTSCKILHGSYLTTQDHVQRDAFMKMKFTPEERERAVGFARCTRASWALFLPETPDEFRRAYCSELGWSLVRPDACRSPVPGGEVRPALECL